MTVATRDYTDRDLGDENDYDQLAARRRLKWSALPDCNLGLCIHRYNESGKYEVRYCTQHGGYPNGGAA